MDDKQDLKDNQNIVDATIVSETKDETKDVANTETSFKMSDVSETVYDSDSKAFKSKKDKKKDKKSEKALKKKRIKALKKIIWKNKTALEKVYQVFFVIAIIGTITTVVLDISIPLWVFAFLVIFMFFIFIVVFVTLCSFGFCWASEPFKNFINNYWNAIQKIGTSSDAIVPVIKKIIPYPAAISLAVCIVVLIIAIVMLVKKYDDEEQNLVDNGVITNEEILLVHKMKKRTHNVNKVRVIVASILTFVCLIAFAFAIYIIFGVK